MRRHVSLLGLSLALLGAPALHAQATVPDTAAAPAATSAADQGAPAAEAPATTSGLPEHAAPPRTLRAYWHVFAAFAIAWLLLFAYAISLGRRFASLEREVQRLEGGRGG
jgi:CcmD family protein